jgi:predicted enzyme related to lactoylglutathione lyase
MERVTGIGGIFFKAKHPAKLAAWYAKHLGFRVEHGVMAVFQWRQGATARRPGMTVWSAFPEKTGYFAPGKKPFMVNYRVKNLDRMLAQLRRARVKVGKRVEESEFGRFGWASDPEGNRFELWEPPPGS